MRGLNKYINDRNAHLLALDQRWNKPNQSKPTINSFSGALDNGVKARSSSRSKQKGITNRLNEILETKQRNLQKLRRDLTPTFTPKINKNAKKLAKNGSRNGILGSYSSLNLLSKTKNTYSTNVMSKGSKGLNTDYDTVGSRIFNLKGTSEQSLGLHQHAPQYNSTSHREFRHFIDNYEQTIANIAPSDSQERILNIEHQDQKPLVGFGTNRDIEYDTKSSAKFHTSQPEAYQTNGSNEPVKTVSVNHIMSRENINETLAIDEIIRSDNESHKSQRNFGTNDGKSHTSKYDSNRSSQQHEPQKFEYELKSKQSSKLVDSQSSLSEHHFKHKVKKVETQEYVSERMSKRFSKEVEVMEYASEHMQAFESKKTESKEYRTEGRQNVQHVMADSQESSIVKTKSNRSKKSDQQVVQPSKHSSKRKSKEHETPTNKSKQIENTSHSNSIKPQEKAHSSLYKKSNTVSTPSKSIPKSLQNKPRNSLQPTSIKPTPNKAPQDPHPKPPLSSSSSASREEIRKAAVPKIVRGDGSLKGSVRGKGDGKSSRNGHAIMREEREGASEVEKKILQGGEETKSSKSWMSYSSRGENGDKVGQILGDLSSESEQTKEKKLLLDKMLSYANSERSFSTNGKHSLCEVCHDPTCTRNNALKAPQCLLNELQEIGVDTLKLINEILDKYSHLFKKRRTSKHTKRRKEQLDHDNAMKELKELSQR